MLKVLSSLENILILASLDSSIESTHISDVSMETAVPASRGEEAVEVEVCRCPPEYKGTSCESCNDHYYRHYDQTCRSCPCNNNEESCNLGPDSQVRCNCRPGFSGRYCEQQGPAPRPSQPPPREPTMRISISEPMIKIVSVGSTVSYNCSAFSVIPQRRVDINWVKEGGVLPSRAQESRGVLIITDAREEDSGVYTCLAKDGYSTQTESVTLTVGGGADEPPSVTIVPESVEAREGERLEVRCQASGSPKPSYSWYRADNTSLNSQIVQDEGLLRFHSVSREDAGVYVCQARNRLATAIQYINLLVRDYTGPTLSVTPRRFNGVEGDTVTIICTAPRNIYRLVWSKRDSGALPSNARDYNGTLSIYGVRYSDSGMYICSAYEGGRRVAETEALIQLGNYRPPPPSPVVSPERQTVPQGLSAEIRCTVKEPAVRISWSKREEQLPSHVQTHGGLLRIPAVRVTDRGMYICTAESSSGRSQHYAILEVERREAPTIELYPRSQQTLVQGSSMLLQCRVTSGIPTPTVYWSRPGNTSIPFNIQQMPNGVLRFNSVQVSDGGEYVCHAENTAGSTSATAQVVVNSLPQVRVTPRGPVQLSSGQVLKMECSASGQPAPTVLWSRHPALPHTYLGLNAPSYGSAVYEVYSVSPEDEGLYICIAKNDAGTTEHRVEVFVNDADGQRPQPPFEDNEVGDKEMIMMPGESRPIYCHITDVEGKRVHLEWVRSDRQELPDGSHQRNGVLYLNIVDQSAGGEYICMLIDDETGAVLQQKRTNIRINFPPKITLVPPRQVVRPGEDARIDCMAEGEQPIHILWEAIERSMPPSVSTQHGRLHFRGITASDAGKYVCKARNRIGDASAVAEVVVSEHETRPLVKALDGRQEASEGSTVTLQCLADITFEMHWNREGHDYLPSNAAAHGNTLRLESVTPEDSGRYRCTVTGPSGVSGSGVSGSDFIELDVTRTQNVKLTIAPSIDVIRVGNTVDLRCITSGVPHTLISWTKVLGKLAENVHVSHNVLRISDVTTKNAGVYRCSTRAPSGTIYEGDYILEVQGADAHDSSEPFMPHDSPAMDVKTADVGSSLSLLCKSNLEPPVSFSWSKQGDALPPNAYVNQSQLVLTNLTEKDAGLFLCKMENGVVSMEKPTMVTVTGLIPSFHQNPISFIALPMLLDAHVQFELELLFKPDQPDGLILYNGQQDGGDGDFISFGLEGGHPQFRFEVGSGPAVINASVPVSLGSWHHVRLYRNKKQGKMWVDGEGPTEGQSAGRYQALDLDRPLYLGSVPDFDQVSRLAGFSQGFVGCISELKVSGASRPIQRKASLSWVGVGDCDTCRGHACTNNGACQQASNQRGYACLCPRGFSDENCTKLGESCYQGACGLGKCLEAERGIKCKCPIDKTGDRCEKHVTIKTPQFSGNSYISYPLNKGSSRVKMSLKFNAGDSSDGILLYTAPPDSNQFAALVLKNNHLELLIDNGHGLSKVRSQYEVTPGEWEVATIGVDHKGAYLQFHNNNDYDTSFKHGHQKKAVGPVLYVGGVDPNIRVMPSLGVYKGLTGCVSSVDVFGHSLNVVWSAEEAVGVTECSIRESTCRTNPCRNGGACSISGNSQSCLCLPGFSGHYCEVVSNPCETSSPCQDGDCELQPGGRYKCICIRGTGGPNCEHSLTTDVSLMGDGYAELSSELMDHSDAAHTEVIEVELTTTSPDGLLLWHGQEDSQEDNDFLAIAVVGGNIEVSYELGSGPAKVVARSRVDDGSKHLLRVNRTAADVHVDLDGHFVAEGSSEGYLSQLNAPGSIYIGGLPDVRRMTRGRYNHGFSGCIHRLRLPDQGDIDFGQEAIRTVNVLPCSNEDDNELDEDYPSRGDSLSSRF